MPTFRFRDRNRDFLRAKVQCEIENSPGGYSLPPNNDNSFTVPDDWPVTRVVATPYTGHWSKSLERLSHDTAYNCKEILPEEKNWWRAFLSGENSIHCAPVKVGVIDLGFSQHSKSRITEQNAKVGFPQTMFMHGPMVCSIISDKYLAKDQGICEGLELHRFEANPDDPPYIDADPKTLQEEFDPDQIAEGIEHLSSVEGVDIINISGGSYCPSDNEVLKGAVADAAEIGTIVLAASGNSPHENVAQPARFEQVVGVGGIGIGGIAPDDSDAAYMERLVSTVKRLTGITIGKHRVFKDMYTSFGDGLDVVAPSIGIPLTTEGNFPIDAKGTSFACPMVAGLLAVELSKRKDYLQSAGMKRFGLAREILFGMCIDLKMEKAVQGFGMPCLRQVK